LSAVDLLFTIGRIVVKATLVMLIVLGILQLGFFMDSYSPSGVLLGTRMFTFDTSPESVNLLLAAVWLLVAIREVEKTAK
jgi:hypothetical protein